MLVTSRVILVDSDFDKLNILLVNIFQLKAMNGEWKLSGLEIKKNKRREKMCVERVCGKWQGMYKYYNKNI